MAGAGEEDAVTVLGVWPSPFAIAVRVALNVKGVPHAYVEEDLVDKSQLLRESNPAHGKVPVLIHNGRAVCDSRVILQYIDEAWAGTGSPPILPRDDPYGRAVARFWAAYVNGEVDAAWRAVARACTEEAAAEAVARLAAALDTLEGAFRECAGGKGFFGGDDVGYVDAVLGGFLPWFGAIDVMVGAGSGVRLLDAARTPLLAAWAERFRATDAAKGVVPGDADAGKVVEYFRALQARWPGAPGD